jgi:hypothetical protein
MPTLAETGAEKLPPHTLIYAESKVGKTRLYGRLAKTRKLVVFDDERSARTLSNADNLSPEYHKNISLWQLPDTKTFPIASVSIRQILSCPPTQEFNFCHAHVNHNCPKCKMQGKPFSKFSVKKDIMDVNGIMVIDTLSQLTSSYIEFIRAKQNRGLEANLMNLNLEKQETIDKFKDDEKLEWDDWAHLGNLCWELLKAIQTAPFEVIAVTHPVMAKYEDGSSKITPSMGSDKFAIKVANHFDNVIYGEIKLGKYNWQTMPSLNGAIVGSRDNIDIAKVDEKKHYSLLEPFHPAAGLSA